MKIHRSKGAEFFPLEIAKKWLERECSDRSQGKKVRTLWAIVAAPEQQLPS